jgi:hypothetical protein
VATLTDIPELHRKHAEKIPEDVLTRLTPEEARYRCAHAAEILQTAGNQQAEHYRYLHSHARKILRSEPVAEHVLERRRLGELETSAPSHEVHSAWHTARREHSEAHAYPPALTAAVDQVFLGRMVLGDPELATVAEAAVRRVKQ